MSTTDKFARQPHVVTDLASRRFKALKIERLLGVAAIAPADPPAGNWLRLWRHSALLCNAPQLAVHRDGGGCARQPPSTRRLRLSQRGRRATAFGDQQFDAVISNHVIEHVGDAAAQLVHLQEIRRVLAPTGKAYLAVPNRWMLTEPHYRLKFLSWLPHAWRSPYLRWMGKGEVYDCEPLQMHELERMLAAAGLQYCNQCVEGWRATFEIERPTHWSTRLLAYCPDALLTPLNPIVPTLIYRLEQSIQPAAAMQ